MNHLTFSLPSLCSRLRVRCVNSAGKADRLLARTRALFALTALVLIASCTGSADHAGVGERSVTIGYLAPLSGPDAALGESARHGAELAEEIVNEAIPSIDLPLSRGRGLPHLDGAGIRIRFADTAGDPDRGPAAVDHLVRDSHAKALVGAYQSAVTLTASAHAEEMRVPFVNGDSSAASLTERNLNWFFRTGPTDVTLGQMLFSLLKEKQNTGTATERIAVIHSDDRYGRDGDALISRLAAQSGRNVVRDVTIPVDSTDLNAQVQQLQSAQPDVVFALAYTNSARRLIDALKSRGYDPPALLAFGAGFTDPKFVKTHGEAAAGLCSRAAWSPDLAQRVPTARAVFDRYRRRFNAPMDDVAARAFTAVMTVAQAIDKAASAEPGRIRAALATLQIPGRDTIMPWDGIRFDENHQNTGARGTVEQLINGRYHVVYPNDVAKTSVRWPLKKARE